MDDFMMPNDGELFNAFQEPEDQVIERRVETSKAQAAKPMLEDLIARKLADIARIDTVSSINIDPTADPDAFMKAWYGIQEVRKYAEDDLAYLESLLITTKR